MVKANEDSDENPLDRQYRALQCRLQPLDAGCHEYEVSINPSQRCKSRLWLTDVPVWVLFRGLMDVKEHPCKKVRPWEDGRRKKRNHPFKHKENAVIGFGFSYKCVFSLSLCAFLFSMYIITALCVWNLIFFLKKLHLSCTKLVTLTCVNNTSL